MEKEAECWIQKRDTNTSQKVPDDFMEPLLQIFLRYRELHSYRKTVIGNMDQTMCRYTLTMHDISTVLPFLVSVDLIQLLLLQIPTEASDLCVFLEQKRKDLQLPCVELQIICHDHF